MSELTEFILARLDEDEATARAASPGPWHPDADGLEVLAVDDITVAEGFALSGPQLRATVDHIARFDPARVLLEVDAKRRIVELHHVDPCAPIDDPCRDDCRECWDVHPCPTLRALVVVWSGHPGFDETWRP